MRVDHSACLVGRSPQMGSRPLRWRTCRKGLTKIQHRMSTVFCNKICLFRRLQPVQLDYRGRLEAWKLGRPLQGVERVRPSCTAVLLLTSIFVCHFILDDQEALEPLFLYGLQPLYTIRRPLQGVERVRWSCRAVLLLTSIFVFDFI